MNKLSKEGKGSPRVRSIEEVVQEANAAQSLYFLLSRWLRLSSGVVVWAIFNSNDGLDDKDDPLATKELPVVESDEPELEEVK